MGWPYSKDFYIYYELPPSRQINFSYHVSFGPTQLRESLTIHRFPGNNVCITFFPLFFFPDVFSIHDLLILDNFMVIRMRNRLLLEIVRINL